MSKALNFVFFSPHFPGNSMEFCFYLREAGARVLGIGDVAYELLDEKLKNCLTEYYRITDMEDYDQIVRAVGYFTHIYGKIDRFESLNEYWLETEARIRTDFNIYGTKTDFIDNLKHKSKMKDFFRKSGVNTVRCHTWKSREKVMEFIQEVGYPVVIKPDSGSGASSTYKIHNEAELDAVVASATVHQPVPYIVEEFVDGIILTYDGLVDKSGTVVFENSHRFEQSIMKVVNTDDNLYYICLPSVAEKVREAGRSILRAFDVRDLFFHIELFERRRDAQLVALEVNMRPPGAWMTDAINYTYDTNIYRRWADMVVLDRVEEQTPGKYFTGYAARKDHKTYLHAHEEIMDRYGTAILNFNRIEEVFSRAMGNEAYQFRAETYEQVKEIINYIQQTA